MKRPSAQSVSHNVRSKQAKILNWLFYVFWPAPLFLVGFLGIVLARFL